MLNEYRQETLQDIIQKSRQSRSISSFLNKSLNDIKKELSNSDKTIKVNALLKLLFLYLNQNDIKWASFNTLEILATCGTQGKRYGYLIAQIQFKNNSECIQLLPNLIRKDLQSQNNTIISNCLSLVNNLINYNLAVDITKDVEKLLNINNNLIRKKIIIALTKASELFLKADNKNKFWDDFMIKLISLLSNKSIQNGVAICLISSFQKMSRQFPEKCITVLPTLLEYFMSCNINWCLIKIIDIFATFFTYEPKLARKEKIIKIIAQKLSQTTSKSVEVQMVKLVITNLDKQDHNSVSMELFQNCEERLRNLLFFPDSNLVILSLRILKDLFNKNKLISENYLSDILKILDTGSNTLIHLECLEILILCSNKSNFKNIIDHLIQVKDKLKPKVITSIIEICSLDHYSRMETKDDFIWFINILFQMVSDEFMSESELLIGYTIRDIAQRIEELRNYIANKSITVIKSLITRLSTIEMSEKSKISFLNESELFGDTVSIKSADSIITVLLFIIGDYATVSSSEIFDWLFEQINSNEYLYQNYFTTIGYCLFKLIVKGVNYISKEKIKQFENKCLYTENDTLEVIEMKTIFINLLKNIYNIENIESVFFETKLMPLHDKAQQMVPPPTDCELAICFTLNEEELNVKKIEETNNEKGKKIMIVDKNLYTPPN